MKIELQQVLPEPIPEKALNASRVWGSALVLDSGKRHLVSGVSGRGKSTLLHVIYGIRKDFKGRLLIDDKDSSAFTEEDWTHLRSRQVALLFQDLRLFPNLTARENMELLPVRDEAALSTETMAERLGVAEYLEKPCGILSQGQRQRMSLIRTLSRSFEILLLDEPFSHLDDENTRKAWNLIEEELKRRHAGLVLSSLDEVSDFAIDHKWKL
ncbi:MAG: ATP-binding cassette domain-containing protein [Verrucomicrobia bacterium]|jgi:ABC-type lipoprotein export system ATPase subunit|nr:ATP-binding cassette domain-containing protein [Verrucomicrobiota bacterium]MDA0722872.1 ATP-binding cassette domain-containing protein [Verrucomicrobiota bacterium]MDA1045353.1 ATP-binding cassette domain-containing protein [Verrucomicrobiota bacterium]